MSSEAPLNITARVEVPAVAQAVTSTIPVAVAPFAGTIGAASYIADANITGAATNTRKLNLVNKGQSGAGALVPASKQFDAGVNAVANDETPLTLSGTASDLVVAQGDVIALTSAAVGTGLADPGGLIEVVFSRS